jgi:hypothetical protein
VPSEVYFCARHVLKEEALGADNPLPGNAFEKEAVFIDKSN